MNVKIHESWKRHLEGEFGKEYFVKLVDFVKSEYGAKTVFPQPRNIFRAFELCPFDEVKVVILGQDPYHGKGQANGLAFSVSDGVAVPPSLQNIYKEMVADLGLGADVLQSAGHNGNLDHWARQGVLLLNATLTVAAGQAGSHQKKGWEEFTDSVIRAISDQKERVVFLLWGRYAQQKGQMIDCSKHLVLEAAHPSPFSAFSGFFGCRHFSKANAYLKSHGKEEIRWYHLLV